MVREGCEGKVEEESRRVRIVRWKVLRARRWERMWVPIVPLAWEEGVGFGLGRGFGGWVRGGGDLRRRL